MRNGYTKIVESFIFELTRELEAIPLFAPFEPKFKQVSNSLWASKEILRLIEENPSESPIDIVTEFANKMDDYSACNTFISLGFSASYDTVMFILDEFIAYGQKNILKED